MDEKIEELMWFEIDETISPSDRETLHAYVNSHEEAREHFDALRKMASLFGRVGEIDPPPELRQRILGSLETAEPPFATRAGFVEWIRGIHAPRSAWRLATVGVIGVMIGVFGYHLVRYGADPSERLDITQFYATMNFEGVDHSKPGLNIDVPGATGAVSIRSDDTRVWAELDVTSENDIEVILEYPGRAVRFAGGNLVDHMSNQVTVEDRQARVRNRGAGTYHFLFELHDDPTSPVTVRILSGSDVLLEEEVYPEHTSKRR